MFKLKSVIQHNLTSWLFAITLPNIFFLFLYHQNSAEGLLRHHAVLFAILFSCAGLVLHYLLRLISKSSFSATLVSVIFWMFFWLFDTIYATQMLMSRVWLFVSVFVLLTVLTLLLRKYWTLCTKVDGISALVHAVVLVSFVLNLIPTLGWIGVNRVEQEGYFNFNLTQDFAIDSTLPTPNIFIFWIDGAMSIYAVETMLGYDTTEIRKAFYQRGFVFNYDYILNTATTLVSMPAILSPHLYDAVIAPNLIDEDGTTFYLSQSAAFGGESWANDYYRRWIREFGWYQQDVQANLEIFQAFAQRGYTTVAAGNLESNVTWIQPFSTGLNYFYAYSRFIQNTGEISFFTGIYEMLYLFGLTTPFSIVMNSWTLHQMVEQVLGDIEPGEWLPIPTFDDDREAHLSAINQHQTLEGHLYRSVLHSVAKPNPVLYIAYTRVTHSADFNQFATTDSPYNIFDGRYITAFNHTMRMVLNAVDMILENDPDAVIIVQSDHGVHNYTPQIYLQDNFDFSQAELKQLFLSTFSAMRFPTPEGMPQEPITPRNITRELVNRFVGPNYTLLPN